MTQTLIHWFVPGICILGIVFGVGKVYGASREASRWRQAARDHVRVLSDGRHYHVESRD